MFCYLLVRVCCFSDLVALVLDSFELGFRSFCRVLYVFDCCVFLLLRIFSKRTRNMVEIYSEYIQTYPSHIQIYPKHVQHLFTTCSKYTRRVFKTHSHDMRAVSNMYSTFTHNILQTTLNIYSTAIEASRHT